MTLRRAITWLKYIGWLPFALLAAGWTVARYGARQRAIGKVDGKGEAIKKEIEHETDDALHDRITRFR